MDNYLKIDKYLNFNFRWLNFNIKEIDLRKPKDGKCKNSKPFDTCGKYIIEVRGWNVAQTAVK